MSEGADAEEVSGFHGPSVQIPASCLAVRADTTWWNSVAKTIADSAVRGFLEKAFLRRICFPSWTRGLSVQGAATAQEDNVLESVVGAQFSMQNTKALWKRRPWLSITIAACIGISVIAWRMQTESKLPAHISTHPNEDGSMDWVIDLPPVTWTAYSEADRSTTGKLLDTLESYLGNFDQVGEDCRVLNISRMPDGSVKATGNCLKLLHISPHEST